MTTALTFPWSKGATRALESAVLELETLTPVILSGSGSPEGVVTAAPNREYVDTAGTAGVWLWVKATGTGNTGWQAVGSGSGGGLTHPQILARTMGA